MKWLIVEYRLTTKVVDRLDGKSEGKGVTPFC